MLGVGLGGYNECRMVSRLTMCSNITNCNLTLITTYNTKSQMNKYTNYYTVLFACVMISIYKKNPYL